MVLTAGYYLCSFKFYRRGRLNRLARWKTCSAIAKNAE
jgi:hypothetical protein